MICYLQLLFLLLALSIPPSTQNKYSDCAPTNYSCGGQSYNIAFPFLFGDRPTYCGFPGYELTCGSGLMLNVDGQQYRVISINYTTQTVLVSASSFDGQACPQLTDKTTFLDSSLFNYTDDDVNLTIFIDCNRTIVTPFYPNAYLVSCLPFNWSRASYYNISKGISSVPAEVSAACESVVSVPINELAFDALVQNESDGFGKAIQAGFGLGWSISGDWCATSCTKSGEICGYDPGNSNDGLACFKKESKSGNRKKIIAIGASAAGAGLIAVFFLGLFLYKRKRRQQHPASSTLLYRSTSSELSSKKDPELGNISGIDYQTHIFSYDELHEATNAFDASKELGDGGFGTVYKGKLRDGRIVAVKRLYESNYKRVEQFMNEVVILSRLRHQNLVTLYGCTSRHSRELLLVYEFVPKGTVADHLHGSRASEGGLTWPVRMSIAIETADALAYLHAVEPPIIHRDVKTNNILLDNSFHVKVADFGLSRLFPLDATHVSTAPQGTPGYVDPEYHQCYQLTDKSDVYSFGVVLMELISSMPAVDITRHRHEINLATMAMNKIQNQELDKFVDHELGYHSDVEVKRMITQVAELAFRCLQMDREMRPNVKEVLEELRGIEIGDAPKPEKLGDADIPTKEESRLLKNFPPYSPDSVADRWGSMSTTPNTSG